LLKYVCSIFAIIRFAATDRLNPHVLALLEMNGLYQLYSRMIIYGSCYLTKI